MKKLTLALLISLSFHGAHALKPRRELYRASLYSIINKPSLNISTAALSRMIADIKTDKQLSAYERLRLYQRIRLQIKQTSYRSNDLDQSVRLMQQLDTDMTEAKASFTWRDHLMHRRHSVAIGATVLVTAAAVLLNREKISLYLWPPSPTQAPPQTRKIKEQTETITSQNGKRDEEVSHETDESTTGKTGNRAEKDTGPDFTAPYTSAMKRQLESRSEYQQHLRLMEAVAEKKQKSLAVKIKELQEQVDKNATPKSLKAILLGLHKSHGMHGVECALAFTPEETYDEQEVAKWLKISRFNLDLAKEQVLLKLGLTSKIEFDQMKREAMNMDKNIAKAIREKSETSPDAVQSVLLKRYEDMLHHLGVLKEFLLRTYQAPTTSESKNQLKKDTKLAGQYFALYIAPLVKASAEPFDIFLERFVSPLEDKITSVMTKKLGTIAAWFSEVGVDGAVERIEKEMNISLH